VRRPLLLAALCMALALAFAPAAMAQDEFDCDDFTYQEDAQEVYDQDTSDPSGLDGPIGESSTGEPGVACEELPSAGTGTDTSVEPAAETSVEPSASASAEPGDEVEATPSASASSSATATASASATAEADLPETGGLSPALTLVPLALLLGAGLLSLRMVRRG
jgi:hypothetical protein